MVVPAQYRWKGAKWISAIEFVKKSAKILGGGDHNAADIWQEARFGLPPQDTEQA
ncbi:MAG: hypothetical protein ACK53F_06270 [Betaproteobacteria bacterium]